MDVYRRRAKMQSFQPLKLEERLSLGSNQEHSKANRQTPAARDFENSAGIKFPATSIYKNVNHHNRPISPKASRL